MIFYRQTARARTSGDDIENFVAIDSPIVSEFTGTLATSRYRLVYLSKRWGRHARPANSSWRMYETAVSVRRGLRYLYRAVDKQGKTAGSLLSADRGMDAAKDSSTRQWR